MEECAMAAIKNISVAIRLGVLVAAGVSMGALSACHVGYNVYPPGEGERGFTNVNSDPFPSVLTESLQWVTLRYPPNADAQWTQPMTGNVGETPYAVNLPASLNPQIATKIVERVGNGARVLTPETEKLPTYHISRVWVNGDEAKVDIVRPIFGITPQDKPLTQGITVRLRGGMQEWHVTSHREWAFDALQAPELNYVRVAPVKETTPATTPTPPTPPVVSGEDER
jgi:hypothetical protein